MVSKNFIINNAEKQLPELLKSYEEKRMIWEKKMTEYSITSNIWTKRDLESEVSYWEHQMKTTACQVVNNLLIINSIDLEAAKAYKELFVEANKNNLGLKKDLNEANKDLHELKKSCSNCDAEDSCDSCKKQFCYNCLGRIGNHLYCDPCYRKKEKLKDSVWIEKTRIENGKGQSSFSWDLNEKEIEKLEIDKEEEQKDDYEENEMPPIGFFKSERKETKPHCIGCVNSKDGVCKRHVKTTPDLSTPEGMAEYKKEWRKNKKKSKK